MPLPKKEYLENVTIKDIEGKKIDLETFNEYISSLITSYKNNNTYNLSYLGNYVKKNNIYQIYYYEKNRSINNYIKKNGVV